MSILHRLTSYDTRPILPDLAKTRSARHMISADQDLGAQAEAVLMLSSFLTEVK